MAGFKTFLIGNEMVTKPITVNDKRYCFVDFSTITVRFIRNSTPGYQKAAIEFVSWAIWCMVLWPDFVDMHVTWSFGYRTLEQNCHQCVSEPKKMS